MKQGAVLVSDEWVAYQGLNACYDHRWVDHTRKQYVTVTGDTSNAIEEGFWTLLKRMHIGIYHYMSRKHMQKYVNDCAFRYNTILHNEASRMQVLLGNMTNRLTYKMLIAK